MTDRYSACQGHRTDGFCSKKHAQTMQDPSAHNPRPSGTLSFAGEQIPDSNKRVPTNGRTMNFPNHQLAMTVLMTPDMANFAGNVHGGAILKLLDQVAYACATRFAGRCRYAVGRSGHLPPADPCRRTRHLSRVCQLHGHYLVRSWHKGNHRKHSGSPRAPCQQLLFHDRGGGRGRQANNRAAS
jgi:hypothetical protein